MIDNIDSNTSQEQIDSIIGTITLIILLRILIARSAEEETRTY